MTSFSNKANCILCGNNANNQKVFDLTLLWKFQTYFHNLWTISILLLQFGFCISERNVSSVLLTSGLLLTLFSILNTVGDPFLHLKTSKIVQKRRHAKIRASCAKNRYSRISVISYYSLISYKILDMQGFAYMRKNAANFGLCLFYKKTLIPGHFSTNKRNICLFFFLILNFLCFK